jgi:hypothetical protein
VSNDTVLVLVVITALAFDFTNGFHDTGNAMATSIATGALGPRTAGGGAGEDSDALVGGSVAGMVIAALCFLIVLAAIGWGIYEVYQIGHPAVKK